MNKLSKSKLTVISFAIIILFFISFFEIQKIEAPSSPSNQSSNKLGSLLIKNNSIEIIDAKPYNLGNSNYSYYSKQIITNKFKAYFRNNSNTASPTRFEKDGYYFIYDISGSSMQWRAKPSQPDAISTLGGGCSSSTLDTQILINGNRISYPNAFCNTNLTYEIYGNMLKENFILSGLPSIKDYLYLEYTGHIEFNKTLNICANGTCYTPKGTQDDFETSGKIEFKDSKNKTIFYLASPYAIDKTGKRVNLTYSVHGSNAQMNFWLRIPTTFIQNATFPITIDPTIIPVVYQDIKLINYIFSWGETNITLSRGNNSIENLFVYFNKTRWKFGAVDNVSQNILRNYTYIINSTANLEMIQESIEYGNLTIYYPIFYNPQENGWNENRQTYSFKDICGNNYSNCSWKKYDNSAIINFNSYKYIDPLIENVSGCRTLYNNTYYDLNTSFSYTGGSNCFVVSGANATFNCNGYRVNATGSGIAFNVQANNFTLLNCNDLKAYQVLLVSAGKNRLNVINNSMVGTSYAIYSDGATNFNILTNNITGAIYNRNNFVNYTMSNNLIRANNIFLGWETWGGWNGNANLTFSDNKVTGSITSTCLGYAVYNSNVARVYNNYFNNCSYGILSGMGIASSWINNNTINNSVNGISAGYGQTIISNNLIINASAIGISCGASDTLSNNTILNSELGISLANSVTLSGNVINNTNRAYSLPSALALGIGNVNYINGKIFYYNVSKSNIEFNEVNTPNSAILVCHSCKNITIKNLNLSEKSSANLYLVNFGNITIINVTTSNSIANNNYYGIYLYNVKNVNITNSTISNSFYGVYLYKTNYSYFLNDYFYNTNISNYLSYSENNTIIGGTLNITNYFLNLFESKNNFLIDFFANSTNYDINASRDPSLKTCNNATDGLKNCQEITDSAICGSWFGIYGCNWVTCIGNAVTTDCSGYNYDNCIYNMNHFYQCGWTCNNYACVGTPVYSCPDFGSRAECEALNNHNYRCTGSDDYPYCSGGGLVCDYIDQGNCEGEVGCDWNCTAGTCAGTVSCGGYTNPLPNTECLLEPGCSVPTYACNGTLSGAGSCSDLTTRSAYCLEILTNNSCSYNWTSSLTNYAINVTYNQSKELINPFNIFYKKWWYQAYVNDTAGHYVSNGNVTVYNKTNSIDFLLLTNLTGWTNITSITEYINTQGVRNYPSNYTINANNFTTPPYLANGKNFTRNITNNLLDILTLDYDATAPQLILISPINFANISVNSTRLVANVSDNYGLYSYQLAVTNSTGNVVYAVVNTTLAGMLNVTLNHTSGILRDDKYFWNYYACDLVNNCNQSVNWNFTIDTHAPNITSLFNDTTNTTFVRINWTTNEVTNYSITILNSTGDGCSCSSAGYLNASFCTCDILSNMVYHINLTVCDIAGNCNSNNTFNFASGIGDNTGPTITIVEPSDHSMDSDGILNFKFIPNDASLIASCSLIYQGGIYETFPVTKNVTNILEIINVVEGHPLFRDDLQWYISCIDNYGNVGNSTLRHLDTRTHASEQAVVGGVTYSNLNPLSISFSYPSIVYPNDYFEIQLVCYNQFNVSYYPKSIIFDIKDGNISYINSTKINNKIISKFFVSNETLEGVSKITIKVYDEREIQKNISISVFGLNKIQVSEPKYPINRLFIFIVIILTIIFIFILIVMEEKLRKSRSKSLNS